MSQQQVNAALKHAPPASATSSAAASVGLSDAGLRTELEYLEAEQSMAGARHVVLPYTLMLCVLSALMALAAPWWACALWAGVFALYIAACWHMNSYWARLTPAERRTRMHWWPRVMVLSSLLFGAAWGSATMIAFAPSPIELRLLWTMALTMVVAGAPRFLTMHQFYALVSAIVALGCGAWLVWGGWLGPPVAAGLVTLALIFIGLARQYHAGLRERFILQLRNEHLAQVLGKRNLELEEIAKAKTGLLAAASHDLRQPVHALGLLMEITRHTTDAESLRRRLTVAADCVDSLSEMLTNLLDFTRMDTGSFPVRRRVASLGLILEDAAKTFEPVARRKELALRVMPTHLAVDTDPNLLRRMVFNLVSNAVKYTETGRVEVYAELMHDGVVLYVQDTGPGIEPARMEEIFRDYVTFDAGSNGIDAGVGLGLGIVRRGAALLGHEVNVRSRLGEGSRFSLNLGSAHSIINEGTEVAQKPAALRGVVAVIENDPIILEGLTDMLSEWGCEPIAGVTPHKVQAMLQALQTRPQLILSDLHLGLRTDGFDAVALLRDGASAAQLPAIILTGDLSPTHQERARRLHVRLEHKPLRPARLREVISSMLVDPSVEPSTDLKTPKPPGQPASA